MDDQWQAALLKEETSLDGCAVTADIIIVLLRQWQ